MKTQIEKENSIRFRKEIIKGIEEYIRYLSDKEVDSLWVDLFYSLDLYGLKRILKLIKAAEDLNVLK